MSYIGTDVNAASITLSLELVSGIITETLYLWNLRQKRYSRNVTCDLYLVVHCFVEKKNRQ